MFTIFRMEMRFDKEIDELFTKFQKGIQLIKHDPRLFRGILYMGVKDVNPNDQEGVVGEFVSKFEKLVKTNKEHNFLCDMYQGQLEINCSPPLGTKGYYDSLEDAQSFIQDHLCGDATMGFPSGKAFLDCIRLVLAKISILDWTSLDDSNQKLQLSEVRSKLPGLIRTGCPIPNDHVGDAKLIDEYLKDDVLMAATEITLERMCREFPEMADKWKLLSSDVVALDRISDRDIDFGVDVTEVGGDDDQGLRATGEALLRLFQVFVSHSSLQVDGKMSVKVQPSFDAFLVFVVRRRKLRILNWAKSLLGEQLPDDWQSIESQFLGRFQMLMNRCSHSCAQCQLGCMHSAVHTVSIEHDCGSSHKCQGRCEYCEAAGAEGKTPLCSEPAGHEGKCECADGDHTCGQECCMVRAVNCGQRCVETIGHEGMHHCSVEIHRCGLACSAKNCPGMCILSIATPHLAHKCEQTTCIEKCSMDGCDKLCGHADHFHGQTDLAVTFSVENMAVGKGDSVFDAESQTPTIHMCADAHQCHAMCGEKGNCYVEVFHKESVKTFVGARGKFKYKFQEMNGFRKKCAAVLAPGQQTHMGPHTCVNGDNASQQENQDDEHDDEDLEATAADDNDEKEMKPGKPEDHGRILHYCERRCPCCSYFCRKEYGHSGMHSTS
ncbi:hypothetical protein Gpo141_00014301, partial [Globisporangium polare]